MVVIFPLLYKTYFIFFSEVQAKDLQLQLDQIVVKEESPYSLKESGRSGKSKSSKSKARRSPYPTVTAPEYTSDYPASTSDRPAAYDYPSSSEMTLHQMQSSYPSIMYPHGTTGQEGMERYGAFYPSAYGHPGFYGDSTVGMYSSYQRYFEDRNAYATRGSYEDRYYTKDTHSGSGPYSGYVTMSSQAAALAAQESPRTGQIESRDAYRGGGTGSSGAATRGDTTGSNGSNNTTTPSGAGPTGNTQQQYDCSIQNSQCSRSSSRDTNYNQTSHSQGTSVYPTPYSNRSESSASEVDVTEEYEKRHGHTLSHRNHHDRSAVGSSYTDSLMEAVRVAEDKKYKENCRETTQTNSVPISNGDSKDSVPTTTGHNHSHQQQQQQQSVIMRRQSNSTLTDLTSRTNDQSLVSAKLHATTNTVDDSRSKSLMDTSRMNSLASSYNHCNYDAYKQSSYHTSLQTSRTYPMMPQAGYTSVIVDATQQYHLANGYAHWIK